MTEPRTTVATTPELGEANLIEITGPILISYSRTSISGVPLLSYQDAELDLDFSGPGIDRIDTPPGELVTVTLDDVVDAFVRTFTLVVPTVRLEAGADVRFDTLGIETRDRSGAFVAAPGPSGVLQDHRIHQLSGTARLVRF